MTQRCRAQPELMTAFERMPVSHRHDYVEWITGAKRADTRAHRVAKAVEMIREGRRQRYVEGTWSCSRAARNLPV